MNNDGNTGHPDSAERLTQSYVHGVSTTPMLDKHVGAVFDETAEIPALAYLLSRLTEPDFPVPLGVFRAVERPTYETLLEKQIEGATERLGEGDLQSLLSAGDVWEVTE